MPTGKTYKSFQYRNNLVWDTARRGRTSAPGKPDIEIGSPPEFKGEAGVWAPEEMLVAALNACMMLTFVAFAQGKKLEFVAYESAAEGLLENVDGKYRIVEVSVRPIVILNSEADIAAARTIMAEVKANCFISNSITADVKLAPQFRAGIRRRHLLVWPLQPAARPKRRHEKGTGYARIATRFRIAAE